MPKYQQKSRSNQEVVITKGSATAGNKRKSTNSVDSLHTKNAGKYTSDSIEKIPKVTSSNNNQIQKIKKHNIVADRKHKATAPLKTNKFAVKIRSEHHAVFIFQFMW